MVKREKNVETCDMKLPVWSLSTGYNVNYWIEGVGSYGHPRWAFYNDMTGGKDSWVVSCSVNGRLIYKKEDFTSGITLNCETLPAPLYDLQGRQLQQKPSKGMYIQGGHIYKQQ